jgi:glycosyltransferase involved in cell wall biosynthesis
MYDVHFRSAGRLAKTKSGLGRIASRIEAAKFRSFETAVVGKFDAVLFGQQADMHEMAPFVRGDAVTGLMPNIVDTDIFKPGPEAGRSNALVFVGAMSHRANVDAIVHFEKELWDRIRARARDVELWLVGASVPDEIRALDGTRGIKVFSDVPDVKPFIDAAAVYIAPLRIGSGVKVKIMEALAMGKAIVATPVAAEGMDLADGRDLRICELGDSFVTAVVEMIGDAGARLALERQARETGERRFGFASGRAELDAIYARLND